MSETRDCATCSFSEVSAVAAYVAMECRRFPPMSAIEMPMIDVEVDGEPVDGEARLEGEIRRYPVVRFGDWCGEWQAR